MLKHITTATVAATAALAALSPAVQAAPKERPGLDIAAYQRDLKAMLDTDRVGVAAHVSDGRLRWDGKAGVSDKDTQAPVQDRARFRIGSTTKTFVATVLLQLAAERRIDLDAPIGRYVPGLGIRYSDKITTRMLLGHRAAIPDYNPIVNRPLTEDPYHWLAVDRFRTWTPRELVDVVKGLDRPEPGGAVSYSNTGYIVAGMIVKKVTGRTYAEEIQRRILRPLGLRNTYLPGSSTRIRGPHPKMYAEGADASEVYDITATNPSIAGAAGEMISTPADLATFNRALLSGRLLRGPQLRQMKAMSEFVPGQEYGLGLLSRSLTRCGAKMWGHAGTYYGAVSVMFGSEDGKRQLAFTIATGYVKNSPAQNEAFKALFEDVFCGPEK
ncbi:serine hydrolase domain-containing protein [Actinomadura rubrisoli]|uniref:Class A beta-lactamase-related serine hydrolase n=1 Tax=Actinomadura rubrisoli TaxID=2530368 RepID=A0A4R5BLW7_9ACTN|nr:serine hydrolase domain-containing protein [Actinomadura rubrisoli]TDD86090.1 class A beta-lactamase-related serine hydrolase [Actinomadura rubrisoli]